MSLKSKIFKWGIVTPLAILGLCAVILLVAIFGNLGPFGPGAKTSSFSTYDTSIGYDDIMMEDAMVSSYAAPRTTYDYEEEYNTAADIGQKIIKTGSLTLVVDLVTDSIEQITSYTSGINGFVQDSHLRELSNGSHSGSITIRIPADQFETALETLKSYATFVEYESISGTDVTEEYTDYLSRLGNAEAEETAYLAVLERAETVEDILAVQEALSDVREEIEVLEGRLQYLEDRTSMSTLTISLSEEVSLAMPNKEFRPWTTVKEAARAFVTVLQGLVTGLIWIGIVGGGILLPLALIIWLAWLLIKKTCKKKCKDIFKKKRR
jgi:hypothetical protein